MKKLASILGIGAISMAVALAPAFAQQTKPQEPAGSATVQPKSGVQVPANQTVKGTKELPGKPAPDVKTVTEPAKADTGAKDQKGSHVKPGANLKSGQPAKSSVHSKAAATPKHHVKKKSSLNPASRMHAKANTSNPETGKTTGK